MRRSARAFGAGRRQTLCWTWRHRAGLVAVAARLAWWVSLVGLWWGATRLFDVHRPLDAQALLQVFAAGAALCSVTLLAAESRPLRWCAWVLGTLHGIAGILVWLACFE